MPRPPGHLPQGYLFHITLRCNSRQFLIAKGLRRDVLLAVLAKAQAKVPHRLYAVCLMANHLHLLIKPDDARQLPRLMHWFGWYSAMALNRLTGRCGHFWEARYTALRLRLKTTDECSIPCGISTPTPKQLECERGFMTPIPTMGTTAGWRVMASANGTQAFCNWRQHWRDAPSVTSGFASGIATTLKEHLGATGAQGC